MCASKIGFSRTSPVRSSSRYVSSSAYGQLTETVPATAAMWSSAQVLRASRILGLCGQPFSSKKERKEKKKKTPLHHRKNTYHGTESMLAPCGTKICVGVGRSHAGIFL